MFESAVTHQLMKIFHGKKKVEVYIYIYIFTKVIFVKNKSNAKRAYLRII